jgi:phosphate/sulfate permease
MLIIYWVFRNKAPSGLNKGFRHLQVVSAAFMAFSHGMADAQKSMGVITLALVSYGRALRVLAAGQPRRFRRADAVPDPDWLTAYRQAAPQ